MSIRPDPPAALGSDAVDALVDVVSKTVAEDKEKRDSKAGSSDSQRPVPITFTAGNAFKAGFFGALGILSAWALMFMAGLILAWLVVLAVSALVSS